MTSPFSKRINLKWYHINLHFTKRPLAAFSLLFASFLKVNDTHCRCVKNRVFDVCSWILIKSQDKHWALLASAISRSSNCLSLSPIQAHSMLLCLYRLTSSTISALPFLALGAFVGHGFWVCMCNCLCVCVYISLNHVPVSTLSVWKGWVYVIAQLEPLTKT